MLSRIYSICFVGLLCSGIVFSQTHPAPTHRQPIYDPKADGAVQITNALNHAKHDHKHVLLQFGANWCGWCYKLHDLMTADKQLSAFTQANFIVVHVDVDKDHNKETNAKYGNPIQFGLPALVVLDWNGKQLTTQDSGKLEEGDHHNPGKVLEFLKKWAPKQPR